MVEASAPQASSLAATPLRPTLALRLRRAFSVRRNLQLLFVPSEHRLRPVDGLRALSVLWVVLFHAGWYIARDIPIPDYFALIVSPWMLPVWRGDFGVDVFFVLSGFLIAGMLIDERERTGRLRLGLFYARRLLRLWPALGVAVLALVIFDADQRRMVWANLLYVNNLVPLLEGTMGWTWSLAMEEQFYLVCPWLVWAVAPLRAAGRVAAVGIVAVTQIGIAAWVVVAGDFAAHDSEIVLDRDFGRWVIGYDHLYVKPWMRAGALLMGVFAAFVFRSPAAMRALSRRAFPVVGLAVALGCAVVCMHWPLVDGAPRAVEVVFMASYRTVFGACVAYVLLLSVSNNPVGLALGRVLSSRLLYPFGQLAYSAYLLNPIVTMFVDRKLAPLLLTWRVPALALFLPFDAMVTFALAAFVYVFVERPFMELRPRGDGQGKTASSQSASA